MPDLWKERKKNEWNTMCSLSRAVTLEGIANKSYSILWLFLLNTAKCSKESVIQTFTQNLTQNQSCNVFLLHSGPWMKTTLPGISFLIHSVCPLWSIMRNCQAQPIQPYRFWLQKRPKEKWPGKQSRHLNTILPVLNIPDMEKQRLTN